MGVCRMFQNGCLHPVTMDNKIMGLCKSKVFLGLIHGGGLIFRGFAQGSRFVRREEGRQCIKKNHPIENVR